MERKVLVVDDDADVRTKVKTALFLRGYNVLDASNGQDGLALARKEKPPIMLQDILISRLDGFRVARLLKFDSRYRDIVLIAITQLARDETKEEAKRVGFDHFLVKPFDGEKVADMVDDIVKKL